MPSELKEILKENAREYYRNALQAEKKGEYNSAVTLFFKAISALCDLYILLKEGRAPSSHADRFRILESSHPSFYQDSYKARLNKETSEMLKDDAKRLFELLKIRMQ
ncbi:MAG: hypothetical protein QME12_04110 [Nanoarchaeota archaeon]|nr:hypothetical protein [Nanoarchaeota archaeon]